ncbi:MAG: TonB-dependent receptor [Flavobacteriales bacterium]|nr:MAG: TonB-dependent receptor [Flavobacteriales bacterium]
MKRQGLFFIILWLAAAGSIFAQRGTIQGVVTHDQNLPLSQANVQVLSPKKVGTITDNSGFFKLSNLEFGTYEIEFRFVGFQTQKISVVLNESVKEINVAMSIASYFTEEVVVSAIRARQNAPFTQVTRSKEEVERIFQGQDAAFLLEELSPSIVSYSESGTSFSNYGGFLLRGMDQTRINITLNGVPLNDMIDQGVFFSNFTDFGNSIESVQIQRGVGTSSNGTSSYAGSINFESLSLMDSTASGEIQLTGGSFGTRRASAEVKTGLLDNNTAFYARYAHMLSDGFRDNMSTNSRSFFFSGAWFGKKQMLKFTGFKGLSANGLGWEPEARDSINKNPRFNQFSPNDRDNFGQWMTQLQHTYEFNRSWSMVNTVYYSGAGGDFPFGDNDPESEEFMQINYPLYNDHVGVMSNVRGSFFNDLAVFRGGVHANTFRRRNLEQIVPNFDAPYYSDRSQKDELSAFGKFSSRFDKVEIFADVQVRAVRLDLIPDEDFLGFAAQIPTREWVFFNPKAGASYHFNDQFHVYGSFGRTGREPRRFDILGSTQINSINLPLIQNLNNVSPEFVNNFEAGTRFTNRFVSLQFNGFFMQFENEIAPIGEFIAEGFVQQYKNMESSYRAGLELDYNIEFLPTMRLRGGATWMNARISSFVDDNTGEQFNNVSPILTPTWNVQTTLEGDLPYGVTLGLRTRYLSETFMELTNNPELVVPSSFVTDLRLLWRFYGDHSLSVQLNNLLNVTYFTYGMPVDPDFSGNMVPGFFVQPPRHIYATLRLVF